MAQLSESEQAKVQMMQDLEIEMMSDLYNRMTSSCHKKCIAPKYHEAEMGKVTLALETLKDTCYNVHSILSGKGENVCIDRCVAKYLDIHERIGKKLTALSTPDVGQ